MLPVALRRALFATSMIGLSACSSPPPQVPGSPPPPPSPASRNTGMGLTIAGIVHGVGAVSLIGAGAAVNKKASAEDRDESVSFILYGAGALTGIVGVPLLAAGIPLWVTGQMELDRYEARHPDVTVDIGPGTVGVTLRVP